MAARIVLSGHEAVLLARERAAPAFDQHGVQLHVGGDTSTVPVRAIASLERYIGAPFELVVVAVRSFSTPEVASLIAAAAACAPASILTVQNGVGNEDVLATALGSDRIVAGALTVAVDRLGPTGARASESGGLCLAPVGGIAHNWIMAALEPGGLRMRAASDWQSLKWSKLCINILANGVCAALDWSPDQVYADALAFSIDRRCFLEAARALTSAGMSAINLIDFPVPALIALMRRTPAPLLRRLLAVKVAGARGGKLPSMLADLRAGRRRVEIGSLNGAVVAELRGRGCQAPANSTLTRIVEGIAQRSIAWEAFAGRPQALAAAIEESARSGG